MPKGECRAARFHFEEFRIPEKEKGGPALGGKSRRHDAASRRKAAYRLLALDMDGTLLDDRQRISDTNAAWIRRAAEAGVIVCLSTGRSFESAVPYAVQLGLDTPMITVNGGEIWSKPYVLHRRTCLPAETVQRLYETALACGDVWFWAYATDGLYNREKWTSDVAGKMWLKFGFHTEDDELRRAILDEISAWGGLEITNSSPYNLEINPAGVSKAAGLAEVCRLVGCSLAETVVVGDSLNDLAAIRAAGLGVAMGNAQEAVKSAADVVTGTNEEDGVAQVIREYLLKGG